jgi:hypothetical protein
MPSFDLISAIDLTAGAALMVGTLALVYPGPSESRAGLAIGFTAWFAVLAALCGWGVFHPINGIGTLGLGLAIVLPMTVLVALVAASPERREHVLAMPTPALIGVHAVRVLGFDFLLLYAAGRLPAPFAPVAGWGDILVGITALPLAWAASRDIRGWRPAAIAWTLFGMADLIAAIGLGVMSAPGSPVRIFYGAADTEAMTTLPWMLIPAFLVPTLFLLHVVVLRQLLGAGMRRRSPAVLAPR